MASLSIRGFADDFQLPKLDYAKWPEVYNAGSIAVQPYGGVKLSAPATVGQYALFKTTQTYNLDPGGFAMVQVLSVPQLKDFGDCGMYLTDSSGGHVLSIQTDGTTLLGRLGNTTVFNVPLNLAQHRWWRIYRWQSAPNVTWSTSADGSRFITQHTEALPDLDTWSGALMPQLQCGKYAAGTPTGVFNVRYFNTSSDLYRPPGHITDDFDNEPLGVVPYGVSFGQWTLVDDGGGTRDYIKIVQQSGADRALQISSPTDDQVPFIRSDPGASIRDLDFTFDLALTSRRSSGTDANSPQVAWRVSADGGNFYFLQVFDEYFTVYYVSGGGPQIIHYSGNGTIPGVIYTWRIIHVGGELVIMRNSGDYAHTGRISTPTVMARITDTHITSSGYVGFRGYGVTYRVNNVKVQDASRVPLEPRSRSVQRRQFGAYVAEKTAGGGPTYPVSMMDDPSVLTSMETKLGTSIKTLSVFDDWKTSNTAPPTSTKPMPAIFNDWAAAGHDILLSWEPNGCKSGDILSGAYDDFLTDYATAAKALKGGTLYIRMFPEMNGDWTGWSVQFNPVLNGVDPNNSCEMTSFDVYKQVWRYIVQKFRDCGATNVKWVFCVNETDEPRTTNTMESYYPGDQWVDVTSFDAYNWGNGAPFNWRTAAEVWRDPYGRLTGLSSRPVWVSETGSKEPTEDDKKTGWVPQPGGSPIDPAHDKGLWVRDMFRMTNFAKVERVIYFSIEKERDWRIDSSPGSLDWFSKALTGQNIGDDGGMPTIDPETFPQLIRPGWTDATQVPWLEYARLTEDGYEDLMLLPSYGGIWVTDIDLGYPEARESVDDLAGQNGTDDRTRFHGAKAISMSLRVMPYTVAGQTMTTQYQISLLARWMQPHRRPVLVFKPKGEPEQRMVLRATSLARPLVMDKRDYSEVQVGFVVPSGRSQATEQRMTTLAPADTAPAQVVTYGTGSADPVIRLYGPLTTPMLVNETLEGLGQSARLSITGSVAAGSFIELDVAKRTVQLNGQPDASASLRYRLDAASWFSIVPFRNFLRLTTGNTADTGTVTVTYTDSYL